MIPAWLQQVAEAFPDMVVDLQNDAGVAFSVGDVEIGVMSATRRFAVWRGGEQIIPTSEPYQDLAPAIIHAIQEARRCTP